MKYRLINCRTNEAEAVFDDIEAAFEYREGLDEPLAWAIEGFRPALILPNILAIVAAIQAGQVQS